MARPTKLYLDYFSHDTDAVNDEKIELFRSMYGNDGYAFYFIILERVYKTEGAMIDLSKNIFVVGLSKKLLISVDKFNEMLETAFELDMFDKVIYENEKMLTSKGIQKRYEEIMNQRKTWNYKKKTKQESIATNELSTHKTNNDYEFSTEKTTGKTTQRKGNRKEKEIETKLNGKENNELIDSNESIQQFSEDVIYLRKLLCEKMLENNPNCKLPVDFFKWDNEIRLLLEKDNYSFTQIDKMIRWCQVDDFWKSNILSAKTLREKAGKLILQMNKPQKEQKKSFLEEMQDLYDYVEGNEFKNDKAGDIQIIDVDWNNV